MESTEFTLEDCTRLWEMDKSWCCSRWSKRKRENCVGVNFYECVWTHDAPLCVCVFTYMPSEDPVQQAASGWLWWLIPVQIWRSRPLRSKHIQISETFSFYHLEERRGEEIWWTLVREFFQELYNLHWAFKHVILSSHTYLILPWDGNTACSKFGVEVIVSLVQIYSLDCGELLYVQHILTVHCSGLGEGNDRVKKQGVGRRNRRLDD